LPPDGPCPPVVDLAQWLHDRLHDTPRVTRQRVAEHLTVAWGRSVAKSTVCRWIDGQQLPPRDLIEAVIILRTQDDRHRYEEAVLRTEAHRLIEAAELGLRAQARARPGRSASGEPRPASPARTMGLQPLPRTVVRAQASPHRSAPLAFHEEILLAQRRAADAQHERDVAHDHAKASEAAAADLQRVVEQLEDQVSNLAHDLAEKQADARRLSSDVVESSHARVQLQIRVRDLEEQIERLTAGPSREPLSLEDHERIAAREEALEQAMRDLEGTRAESHRLSQQAKSEIEAAQHMRSRAFDEASRIRAQAQSTVHELEQEARHLTSEIDELRRQRAAAAADVARLQRTIEAIVDAVPSAMSPSRSTRAEEDRSETTPTSVLAEPETPVFASLREKYPHLTDELEARRFDTPADVAHDDTHLPSADDAWPAYFQYGNKPSAAPYDDYTSTSCPDDEHYDYQYTGLEPGLLAAAGDYSESDPYSYESADYATYGHVDPYMADDYQGYYSAERSTYEGHEDETRPRDEGWTRARRRRRVARRPAD
jgi:hypothetical protein